MDMQKTTLDYLSHMIRAVLSFVFQLDVSFSPTAEQQTSCRACGQDGLNGDLVIVYEVLRDDNLGDLKVESP